MIPANGPVRRPALVRPVASSSVDDRPIGMFDSGFGGLSVARALIDLAPAEDLVYVGDTGRYPYGPRAMAEVRSFAVQIGRWLVDEHDVKLIVVACNTASAAGLEALRAVAAGAGRRGHRPGRAGGGQGHAKQAGGGHRHGGDDLVGRLPAGHRATAGHTRARLRRVPGLRRVRGAGRDPIGPGGRAGRALAGPGARGRASTPCCWDARTTRSWPAPSPTSMGRDVVLVSSADETAFEVRAILADASDLGGPSAGRPGRAPEFFSSGDVEWFRTVGGRLFGAELGHVGESRGPPSTPTTVRAAPPTTSVSRVQLTGSPLRRGVGLKPVLSLTVLGCDGSHAGAGRCRQRLPGAVVGDGDLRLARRRAGHVRQPAALLRPASRFDAIVLSHEHPDHWSDIEGFFIVARWTVGFHRPPIPVLAAPGIREPNRPRTSRGSSTGRTVGDGDGADVGELRAARSPAPTIRRSPWPSALEGAGRHPRLLCRFRAGVVARALGPGLDLALCEATYTKEHEGTAQSHERQTGRDDRPGGGGAAVWCVTHRWPTITGRRCRGRGRPRPSADRVDQAAVGRGYSL